MRSTVFYILTLLTGVQFALLWLFLMTSQTNKINNAFHPTLKHHAVIFFTMYSLYLSLIFYGIYQSSLNNGATSMLQNPVALTVLLIMAVGLLWYAGILLFKIAGFIRSHTIELPGNMALILLVFVYAAAFPLLQSRLNRACR